MFSASSVHSSSVAVVVPSCDKYSDLWDGYFRCLSKYWPDCPYEVFLVANDLRFSKSRLSGVINVGEDRGWSANLLAALDRVPHDYVLMMMDDLFIIKTIDTARIAKLLELCVAGQWNYLRLNPTPGPIAPVLLDDIGEVPAGDWYRSSTVFSVWRKDVLLSMLRPGESAWQFEIYGSKRTNAYGKWFACSKWNTPFVNLVIKGKIDPASLKRLNSGFDLSLNRPRLNTIERGAAVLKRARSKLMLLVPRRVRQGLREKFGAY